MNIEICKQIASELGKRYMEIMDYGGDQSEADSVGTPFKDGHLAIEFALKEIERLTAERDEARREIVLLLNGCCSWSKLTQEVKERGWECLKEATGCSNG